MQSLQKDGVYLAAGGSVSNVAGGLIAGNGYANAIDIAGAAGTVVNAGVISYGIYLGQGGSATNAAGAKVIGSLAITGAAGTVVNAGAMYSSFGGSTGVNLGAGGTVTNTGGIFNYEGSAGVRIAGASGTVVNYGVIKAFAYPGYGLQDGVNLQDGGSVINAAGGNIYGSELGVAVGGAAGTVLNAGAIDGGIVLAQGGTVRNAAGGSVGGLYGVTMGAVGTVVNAGTIAGGGGFFETGGGVVLGAGGSVTNAAGGVIEDHFSGDGVVIGGGNGTVVNAGTISGAYGDAVYFHPGYVNRLTIVPGAVFDGTVDGGNTIGGTIASTLELAAGTGPGTLSGVNSQFIDFADILVDPNSSWQLAGDNSIVAGQHLTVDGSLSDPATLTLIGNLALQGGSLSAGSIDVAAGGTLGRSGTITASVTDEGLVEAAGGTLVLAGPLDLAPTGTLLADAGMLELTGTGNVIAGALDQVRTGPIAFVGASTSTIEGDVSGNVRRIDLFDNASLTLGTGLSRARYGGIFDDTSTGTTTFDTGADNFTLSGHDTFVGISGQALITGSATLTLAGRTYLAEATLGGSETLHNSGALKDNGPMTIGDTSTSAATVSNTGTWDITSDSGIGHGAAASSSFTNHGIFEKTGGFRTSVISANFVNDGTIIADAGTLEFTGGFTNHGTIIQNGGTVIIMPASSPALFNQYAAGIDAAAGSAAASAPPPQPPAPLVLAAPHFG